MADIIELGSPFGPDLLLHRLQTEERLSFLYEYRLDLLSLKQDLDPDEILSQPVTIRLALPDDDARFFTGFCTEFSSGGVHGRYFVYHAVLRPSAWFLTRTADCKIFQKQKVPAILSQMFDKYGAVKTPDQNGLNGDYREWNYCVQYRESDFNFISRLMEHEGIYYYFKHDEQGHTMMLVDNPSAHEPVAGYETFKYRYQTGQRLIQIDCVSDWRTHREIRSGEIELRDYDFVKPASLSQLEIRDKKLKAPALMTAEVFDYPGGYNKHDDGKNYAEIRLQELQTAYQRINGAGNVRAMEIGSVFTLQDHPNPVQNAKYMVTRLACQLVVSGYESSEEAGFRFSSQFSAIPSDQQFRPRRATPKPVVQGPQTAVVVGPSGDEIYTDPEGLGQVKVHFFWDRHGEPNENASCWIRVSQPWAGGTWGMIANPRIGHEVIVEFLEGDPDQPIITGRVYNGVQKPPYTLPTHNTQTGIKTRSSPGGNANTFNELRFEDKKGVEEIAIHAERDMNTFVENNSSTSVQVNMSVNVGGNQTISVGSGKSKGTKTEVVTDMVTTTFLNSELHMVTPNRNTIVTADEGLFTNNTVSVAKTNYAITVGAAYTVGTNTALINSKSDTTLVVGGKMGTAVKGNFDATAANFTYFTGGDVKFQATNFNRKVIGANDTILGSNASFYMGAAQSTTVGTATSVVQGVSSSYATLSTSAALVGISNILVSLSNAVLSVSNAGIGMGFTGINLTFSGLALSNQSLKLITGGSGSGAASAAASFGEQGAGAVVAVAGAALGGGFAAGFGVTAAIQAESYANEQKAAYLSSLSPAMQQLMLNHPNSVKGMDAYVAAHQDAFNAEIQRGAEPVPTPAAPTPPAPPAGATQFSADHPAPPPPPPAGP